MESSMKRLLIFSRRFRSAITDPTSAPYAQDHIMAERKHREKINKRVIELSTVIPCLKKVLKLIHRLRIILRKNAFVDL